MALSYPADVTSPVVQHAPCASGIGYPKKESTTARTFDQRQQELDLPSTVDNPSSMTIRTKEISLTINNSRDQLPSVPDGEEERAHHSSTIQPAPMFIGIEPTTVDNQLHDYSSGCWLERYLNTLSFPQLLIPGRCLPLRRLPYTLSSRLLSSHTLRSLLFEHKIS